MFLLGVGYQGVGYLDDILPETTKAGGTHPTGILLESNHCFEQKIDYGLLLYPLQSCLPVPYKLHRNSLHSVIQMLCARICHMEAMWILCSVSWHVLLCLEFV